MYVYVISNEAYDGWLKVGKTKDLYTRIKGLNTASPFDYEIELVEEFHDDRPIHNRLIAMGIERRREWFKADVETVETVIADVMAQWHPEPDSLSTDLGCDHPGNGDEDVRRSANLVLFKREA